jgi:hypothetical protein
MVSLLVSRVGAGTRPCRSSSCRTEAAIRGGRGNPGAPRLALRWVVREDVPASLPAGDPLTHAASRPPKPTHQPLARDSPTHADPEQQPVAAREAARAPGLAHNNSAICRLSSHPPAAALDFRQRTCDEPRSWGTQPPNMSMTDRREPADARTAPRAATTSTTTTNQTIAINPYPLTPAPPYGRHGDRAGPVRLAPCRTIGIARTRTHGRRRSRGCLCPEAEASGLARTLAGSAAGS